MEGIAYLERLAKFHKPLSVRVRFQMAECPTQKRLTSAGISNPERVPSLVKILLRYHCNLPSSVELPFTKRQIEEIALSDPHIVTAVRIGLRSKSSSFRGPAGYFAAYVLLCTDGPSSAEDFMAIFNGKQAPFEHHGAAILRRRMDDADHSKRLKLSPDQCLAATITALNSVRTLSPCQALTGRKLRAPPYDVIPGFTPSAAITAALQSHAGPENNA